eukprot:m.125019 g.125019  ORF g.125019 m.125019 type:complete len:267 (+) comp29097_c0_seq1:197-997(+)
MSSASFDRFIAIHQSYYGSEKLIKTVETIFKTLVHFFEGTRGVGSELPVGLKQLASQISSARYILRFHGGGSGILAEVHNLQNVDLGGYQNPKIKQIFYLKIFAMFQYYSHENLAFLGWSAPDLIGKRLGFLGGADELGRRSTYGWGVYLMMNIYAARLKFRELARLEITVRAGRHTAKAKDKAFAMIDKTRSALWLGLVSDVAFLIPATQNMLTSDSKFRIVPRWLMIMSDIVENITGYYTLWNGTSSRLPNVQLVLDAADQKIQ